ncbi:MAG: CoA transferase [Dehalococcoidia bacterium]
MPSTALEGVRVLDLTRGWSGPIGVRLLGDLGAEVIKIESLMGRGMAEVKPPQATSYPRVCHAAYPNNDPGEEPYNRYGPFNEYHRNKLSLTLDLTNEECKEIFRRLASLSDVVVENYSPRVMRNFGLDYPALSRINPAIIMISMPGFGMNGPYRNYVSYGTDTEPSSGFCSLIGYPGPVPYKSGEAYSDPNAGLHAVGAVLTALFYRRRTGKGQFIDLSQRDALVGLIGERLLASSMNREEPQRMGNSHPYYAPHGCYRCRGEDRWVTIAVTSEEEWSALCDVLGNPPWTREERFADQMSRWQNQKEIDAHLSRWTAGRDYMDVMHTLQARGVPAAAVFTNQDIVEDPHLKERGYFWDIPHPRAGTLSFPGVPVRLSRTPGRLIRPAPTMGEHNNYVILELLGLQTGLAARLEEEGAIGTHPPTAYEGPAYG